MSMTGLLIIGKWVFVRPPLSAKASNIAFNGAPAVPTLLPFGSGFPATKPEPALLPMKL